MGILQTPYFQELHTRWFACYRPESSKAFWEEPRSSHFWKGNVEDAHVLGVEILTERYSGFHHGTMGTFLVRFRLLYYPTVPTFYCNSSSFALYLFGTSYTFIISVFYFSRDPFEPIPTSPKIRGIRDTLAFLSQLQVLGSTRWYGLRRENESSRVGV